MSHTVVTCPVGDISNGEAFAVELRGTVVKRKGEYVSEDESSICKYRKITTEDKILNARSEKTIDPSYAGSDESFDEYSNDERDLISNISNDEDNSVSESADCNNEESNTKNGKTMSLTEYKRMIGVESDSDAPLEETPAQEDLFQSESSNIIAGKLDGSQDNVANIVNVHEASQLAESKQEIGMKDSEPDNSIDGTHLLNGIEHPNDPNVTSNTQIALVQTQPYDGNANLILKRSDSIKVDANHGSEIVIQDTSNGQVYEEQASTFHSHSVEHPHPIPSTSGAVREPITHVNTAVESDPNVANELKGLRQDIQTLIKRFDKQESILATVVAAQEMNLTPLFAQDFNEKYGFKLPFTKLEDFHKFNQELVKSVRFCNEFIANLCSYIDNRVTLDKNIATMIRKYMSKDLATLFNASKPTNTKMVLKDTMFCKCLLQATKLTIRNGLLPLEHEKAFITSLGHVMSRARVWPTDESQRSQSQA